MPAPYFSEIKYRGNASNDFAEVVLDAGSDPADYSVVVYHPSGGIRSVNSLGSLQDTVIGLDVYVVNTGIHKNGAVALVENGIVISFVSFDSTVSPTTGPAAGMTSTQIGSTGNNQNQSLSSTDGVTYTAGPINEGTIPCFLAGTAIATLEGPQSVETLRPGDRVLTAGGGTSRVAWVGISRQVANGRRFVANAPVCIPQDAFGPGRPIRDLYVSPNHRIRLDSPVFELCFWDNQVLVPAKFLIGWRGIHQSTHILRPDYVHLLFDQHEVVLSEGLETESFHPSDATIGAFDADARAEFYRLFPDMAGRFEGHDTAHPCLRRHERHLVPMAIGAAGSVH